MDGSVTMGLLHPGRMGAAVGALLTSAGHRVLWCSAGRSADTARRAEQAGLVAVPELAELLAASAVLFSVCPPANAADLAEQVRGYHGIFVEANAISPQRMAAIAELLGASATVLDGAIIGPPPQAGNTARLYLAGPSAGVAVMVGLLAGSAAEAVSLGDRIGAASALKMAYGSFQKTSRALAAVSHALADDYGVGASLQWEAERLGRNALADRGHLPSVAARAWRWAPEMLEGADSLRARGLPEELCTGSAAVLNRWAADRDNWALDETTALAHLRERHR